MKKGFTLVELLVIVGVMMIIMVSIGGIVSGVFSSQRKNKVLEKISISGGWVLNELKKNILNSDGTNFVCPAFGSYGSSITMTNVKDGEKTTITCFNDANGDYKIASISGKSVGTTIYLFEKNNDLVLRNCENFVSCESMPDTSSKLSKVKFNFTLGASDQDNLIGQTKVFSTDLTVRN